MTILAGDIEFHASTVLDDTDQGGGEMTGTVIESGSVGTLFGPVSDAARAAGNLSLRQIYAGPFVDNVDTLYGAYMLISQPPDDPAIHATLFAAHAWGERRGSTAQYIESYLTVGPRSPWTLYGNQVIGSRMISLMCQTNIDPPAIGQTLILSQYENTVNYFHEAIRVENLQITTGSFVDSEGKSYSLKIIYVTLVSSLKNSFLGSEASKNCTATNALVRLTVVADASNYYGITTLTDDVKTGDLSINVDSIYTQLIPSTNVESAIIGLNFGVVGPLVKSGDRVTYTGKSGIWGGNYKKYLGRGMYPGSLSITTNVNFTDNATGSLLVGSVVAGTIDYTTGELSFNYVSSYTGSPTISFIPAISLVRTSSTISQSVTPVNRGYTWIVNMLPLPSPGTISVDYRAAGNWVRLTDDSLGNLAGSAGAGTVNYSTGVGQLTTAALPDANTDIIWSFGATTQTEIAGGSAITYTPELTIKLSFPVVPGTVSVQYKKLNVTHTATDDSKGLIKDTGVTIGSVNYTNQIIILNTVPDGSSNVVVTYSTSEMFTATVQTGETDTITGTMSGPVIPGTVSCYYETTITQVELDSGSKKIDIIIFDNGLGNFDIGAIYNSSLWNHPWGTDFSISMKLPFLDNHDVSFSDIRASTINYSSGEYEIKIFDRKIDWAAITIPTGSSSTWTYFYVDSVTSLGLPAQTNIYLKWQKSSSDTSPKTDTVPAPPIIFTINPTSSSAIVPNSVIFTFNGKRYIDRNGALYVDLDESTGAGALAGTINYTTRDVSLSNYVGGTLSNVSILSCLLESGGGQQFSNAVTRINGAPLRVGSVAMTATTYDGQQLNATSDMNGGISADGINGTVNFEMGILSVNFGNYVDGTGHNDDPLYDFDNTHNGLVWKKTPVLANTALINAVAISNLPLSEELLGIDATMLPLDGRVPSIRSGNLILLHNKIDTELTDLIENEAFTLRPRLETCVLKDSGGNLLDTNLYTVDKYVGTVTVPSLAALALPLTAEHRITDLMVVSDVQISGDIRVTRQITHDYPAGTYVSACLYLGNRQAVIYKVWSETTWVSDWSEIQHGSVPLFKFDTTNYPITTTNRGAEDDQIAIIFTNSTSFNIISKNRGQIGTGVTASDCNIYNPAGGITAHINKLGWGAGWSTGNVLRIVIHAATSPVWIARTVSPSEINSAGHTICCELRSNIISE